MRRRFPRTVKVIGNRYKVSSIKGLMVPTVNVASFAYVATDEGHVHEHIDVSGLTDPSAGIIQVEDALSEDRFRTTLLHEVLHAIFSEAGLHDAADSDVEERIITRMAPILRQTLKDNPQLTAFVVDGYYAHTGRYAR